MKTNFIETAWSYFDDSVISKASEYLGESESTIRKSLTSIIPIVLAGTIHKAEKGDVETLATMAKDAFKTDILKHRINTFTHEGGGIPSYAPTMLTNLFGDKIGSIQNKVTNYFESKGASTASLFGTAVPVILALLGKHASDNNLSPSALASALFANKADIVSAIPSELGLSLFDVKKVAEPVQTFARKEEEKKTNWWLPLLGLLLLGGLLWWFLKGNKKDTTEPTVVTEQVVVHDTLTVEKEPLKLSLPNGVTIDAYKGGIEDLLIKFIEDPNAKPGNDNWFDFNDLNFNTGTAEMVPDSKKELTNIIEILKAFPNVKIKIGGYTDKVGDENFNKKLSNDRANAIAKSLNDAGLGSQVLGAEGYGSDFAKYPASAPEEDRIEDRRVSVSVREK